jgi:DNA-binding transcriptional LysR family regulator
VSTCTVCKDAGGCPHCRGTGTLKGKRCLICRGDGACPVCKRPSDPAAAELILYCRRVSPVDGQSSGRSLAGVVGGQSPGNLSLAAVARPSVAGNVVLASSPEPPVVVARWSNARLTARAVLVLLFLVAFYAFALATIGVLLLITWARVQLFNRLAEAGLGIGCMGQIVAERELAAGQLASLNVDGFPSSRRCSFFDPKGRRAHQPWSASTISWSSIHGYGTLEDRRTCSRAGLQSVGSSAWPAALRRSAA